MDGKGAWRDNVFVERLWRSVKYEEVYLHAYDSVLDARVSIGRYLDLYNRCRPRSSLDGMTPYQAYYGAQTCRQSAWWPETWQTFHYRSGKTVRTTGATSVKCSRLRSIMATCSSHPLVVTANLGSGSKHSACRQSLRSKKPEYGTGVWIGAKRRRI